MARARISTDVDEDLLTRARALSPGSTDAAIVDVAFTSLLRAHSEVDRSIDALYETAYARVPVPTIDEWGHLETFLDGA
ncbi:antitoxin MazE5 [Ornithinimicrobium kibberense]|uniref:Antitoxin MazE5 n=1 Tax=Ornithinimicrobium kibberense TaxID=282060 RepID=A0ABV5V5B0_9MICO|nr:antitoxin MazE5 [Ornithinimicrobium kibberense]